MIRLKQFPDRRRFRFYIGHFQKFKILFVFRGHSCILIMIVGFGILIAGCSSKSNIADRSFITEQPCKPPCWQDLYLNKSTTQQVHEKLKELPFVDQSSITTWDHSSLYNFPDSTLIRYSCFETKNETCGLFVLADGILKETTHAILYPLSLQRVVEKLGEPHQVLFLSPHTPHGQGCLFAFTWPDQNIQVERIESDTRYCQNLKPEEGLDPEMRIVFISYSVSEIFHPDVCEDDCLPWPGFKEK